MGMTIDECVKMLMAKEKCIERETSGTDTDCNNHNCDNCDLCYEQGTMGEQKEALKFGVDTMRNYQKIEEIMNQEQAQWGVVKDTWLYKEIKEIVKGNQKNGKFKQYKYRLINTVTNENKVIIVPECDIAEDLECFNVDKYALAFAKAGSAAKYLILKNGWNFEDCKLEEVVEDGNDNNKV